jgi:antitoxin VapB
MGILMKKKGEKKSGKVAKHASEKTTAAVGKRLPEVRPRRKKRRTDRKNLSELLAYFNSLPKVNEHLSDEEIIGYDENGVPN